MLNLRQLEYFYYVAKHGGFTRAARQLLFSIQQPALSIRVKALEADLKVKLYQVVGRKFQLTSSGEYLFNAIEPFFESLETVDRHLRGETHGRLVVAEAAPMLILNGHRAAFLKFRERYPSVQVSVLERNWTNLLEHVSEGAVDFAFGSAPEARGNFSFEEWTETDYLLNVVFETSSYSLINEAVLNGAGIAIVNALWPRPETANGWETTNISHLFGKKRIGLFRRNDIYLPPYAGDYLTMLREALMT